MRPVLLSMVVLSMMKVCGGGDAPTPPVGAAAGSAITVTAQHGGVMVAADDGAWIELVAKQSGDVEAYVVDSQGQALPPERASVQTIQVQGTDGRPHEVAVAYDPVERRYAGRVDVTPVAAQAEVQIVVAGRPPRRAVAPQVVIVASPPQPPSIVVAAPPRPGVVVAAPPPRVSGTVVVEGPQAPSVVVQAPQPPSATVVLQAPRPPGVVVTAPSAGVVVSPPRAGVVVAAPPRPGVVVVAPPTPQVVVAPPRPGVVVVEGDGHPGRGRGHAYGRRGREAEGTVVVAPPRAGVVVTPPRPGAVVVGGGGGGRVEVRAGGGGGRGRGRGHD